MTSTTHLTISTSPPTPAAGCDCGVCPFFIDNPEAIEAICSGCNTDCAYCGCARPLAGHPGACDQCPIRCGSRTDITAWMADIGGTLRFDDIDFDDLTLPTGLPRFIPQVDTTELGELDTNLRWPAYAVRLRSVLSPVTHTIVPGFTDTTAGQALGLADNQLAVLAGYAEDPLVEAFWSNRFALTDQIAHQGWDVVLAPNFSMYGNFPRAEHLINFRRNLLIARDMIDAGIPAVPNLYWFRLEDLERYEELLVQVTPAAVAVNLQTFRTDRDWDTMAIPGLTYLASGFPPRTSLIVTGTSRASRIGQLRSLFARMVLVAQNPTIHAVFEATKGLAERLRTMTGLTNDGGTLVDQALAPGKSGLPALAINTLLSETERSEQTGLANLTKGVFGMFRNVAAHAPKITWTISEPDALDLFTTLSLIHRRLDNATTTGPTQS